MYSPECDKGRGISHWLPVKSVNFAILLRAPVPDYMQHPYNLTLLGFAISHALSLGFPLIMMTAVHQT